MVKSGCHGSWVWWKLGVVEAAWVEAAWVEAAWVEAAWMEAGCSDLFLQSQLEEVMTSGPLDFVNLVNLSTRLMRDLSQLKKQR